MKHQNRSSKRHPSLRELSVDHHHALVQAHRLIKAANGDEAAQEHTVQEFFVFWNEHANSHFREEDEALLPFFARFGEVNQEPVNQMLREHVLIRRLVKDLQEQMSTQIEPSLLRTLGETFEAHVRLEERVVFPILEATIPEDVMPELAAQLEAFRLQERATTV
jgi:hemerythrin-like domain-containing protein